MEAPSPSTQGHQQSESNTRPQLSDSQLSMQQALLPTVAVIPTTTVKPKQTPHPQLPLSRDPQSTPSTSATGHGRRDKRGSNSRGSRIRHLKRTRETMAMELYVGEKGLLFCLNKFTYASIFIIIGGWMLFRFVGPSLSLYKLHSPSLVSN